MEVQVVPSVRIHSHEETAMSGLDGVLLGVALLLGNGPSVTADEFQGWFEEACRSELAIPRPIARRAQTFQYIFIGGFRVGRMPGYFAQNARELGALGIPRRSIHFIYPSSDRTVEENCITVREELFRIAARDSRRLVVIAHSRGACDALSFALNEPEFVNDRVEALFLVQGAFGGTGLADYVLGGGDPMDGQMSRAHRWFARAIGAFERWVFRRGHHDGLIGMSRDASRAYWADLLKVHADAIPLIGPKVFFIESCARPKDLSILQRAMAWYLEAYYGPNDGVVAVVDQTVPGIGTSLGVLNAGHADLTRRAPAARPKRRLRRALSECIVMVVGRPHSPCPDAPLTNRGRSAH
jgi:pimeloyl-ACP methyl ester carboxylesterase